MKLAVCIWDFEASAQTVEPLCRNGVQAVELGGPFIKNAGDALLETTLRLFQEGGIRVGSCHAPFGDGDDLSSLDEATRGKAVAGHRAALDRTARLKAACLVVHPSGPIRPEETRVRWAALRRSVEDLLPEAERQGVVMALENMLPGHLGASGEELAGLLDEMRSPWLGICFDTGHAQLSGEGAGPMLAAVRRHVKAFHLQDNDGVSDKHLQPPYGVIDWEAVAREAARIGGNHVMAVEAPPWNRASLRTLLREVEALLEGKLLTVPWGGTRVRLRCERCGHFLFGAANAWTCACGET